MNESLDEMVKLMKEIRAKLPKASPEERITVFLEYRRSQKAAHPANLRGLVSSLEFKPAKNGKSEVARTDRSVTSQLPSSFEFDGYTYFTKDDAIIRVKRP
ncbi:MAG: hypothetical protein ACP5NC_07980 [Nitrososphaeria archaeon]